MTLTLVALRDLLFKFPLTPELNAAKYYEARQPYAAADAACFKIIATAELGAQLKADPECENVFYVQIKDLPLEYYDAFASKTYAVIWLAAHWLESTEYQLTKSDAALQRKAKYEAEQWSLGRLNRIAHKIATTCDYPQSHIYEMLTQQTTEEGLRTLINIFEEAAKCRFYEQPNTKPPV